jgi:hypothetical protein
MKAAAGIKLCCQKSASLLPKDELWVWKEIYQCHGKKMQHKKCGMQQESISSVAWVINKEEILQTTNCDNILRIDMDINTPTCS